MTLVICFALSTYLSLTPFMLSKLKRESERAGELGSFACGSRGVCAMSRMAIKAQLTARPKCAANAHTHTHTLPLLQPVLSLLIGDFYFGGLFNALQFNSIRNKLKYFPLCCLCDTSDTILCFSFSLFLFLQILPRPPPSPACNFLFNVLVLIYANCLNSACK